MSAIHKAGLAVVGQLLLFADNISSELLGYKLDDEVEDSWPHSTLAKYTELLLKYLGVWLHPLAPLPLVVDKYVARILDNVAV